MCIETFWGINLSTWLFFTKWEGPRQPQSAFHFVLVFTLFWCVPDFLIFDRHLSINKIYILDAGQVYVKTESKYRETKQAWLGKFTTRSIPRFFFSVILCNSTPSETKSTRLNSLLNENIEKSEPYGKSSWLSETCSHCQLWKTIS